MQDERDPLGGSKRLEYDPERGTDRVGEQHFVSRVSLMRA